MFQRKRIDNRNRQAEAKTLQAHAIQKDFVQAGVMYEQNAARQNLYDPVERDAPIETSTNNSVGQSMHDRTITDVTARTDNKSLGCLQIDPAVADQNPADAEHIGSSGIQAGRFDIEADKLHCLEGCRTGRKLRNQ